MSVFKQANTNLGATTPNVEKSQGTRPSQHYMPASYLPLVRYDNKLDDYKVISLGKVISADSKNYVVPAGLAIDIEYAIANSGDLTDKADFITETANFGSVYSDTDVTAGVLNALGDVVTAAEPVVASFFTAYEAAGVQLTFVGDALGIAPYDIWRQNGAGYGTDYEAGNPASYNYTNWNPQQGLSILTRYFIELPVVSDASDVIYPGLAVFEGTPAIGGLVSYNNESNFVMQAAISDVGAVLVADINAMIAEVNANNGRVLGKVYFVDDHFPKDYLEYVRTWDAGAGATGTANVPGSATNGLPDALSYAGETDPSTAKMVRINLLV